MGAMINEDRFGVCALALDVASVAANTSAEQSFTVKGLRPGDFLHLQDRWIASRDRVGLATRHLSRADILRYAGV